MKQTARKIFESTLAALDLRLALERKFSRQGSFVRAGDAALNLRRFREIVAVAVGKAAFGMAEALTSVLVPEFSAQGILVLPAPPPRSLPGWQTFMGGHPIPNERSFAAGRAILNRLRECDESSLIFFLLSGGGSALVEESLDPGVTQEDFQQLNRLLVGCGAPIDAINSVRKHLSAIKGGRLAQAAPRSMKITLAVTDVPEGQESALASGPTLPDPSTVRDAERVVAEYRLLEKLPASVRDIFQRRAIRETPKAGDLAFERAQFLLILAAHDLLHNAHRAAEAAGFRTICDNSTDNWPLQKAADHLLTQLSKLKRQHPGNAVAVIADGELSSPVTGEGAGGRNAAFVLSCVPKIAAQNIVVLSAGTDGIDGNSPAAGAVADGSTLKRAEAAGMNVRDYLLRSDSHTFFARLGDAIFTGPTGNNLRDLRIFLAW